MELSDAAKSRGNNIFIRNFVMYITYIIHFIFFKLFIELFYEGNIDGRDMYYIDGNNKFKNAMMQKARMCRESKQSCATPTKKDSPLKKNIRICLTKVKESKTWNSKRKLTKIIFFLF